ncbi:aspartyl protease family protein [Gemmatimonas aurantiaca]|nr:aspartyl protease family protein [Gemmatimonas aurantiaca]
MKHKNTKHTTRLLLRFVSLVSVVLTFAFVAPAVAYGKGAERAESAKDILSGIYVRADALEALQNLSTIEMTGEIRAFELHGAVTMKSQVPDKSFQKMDLDPLVIIQIINGDNSWLVDQNESVIALSGYELESMISGTYLSVYGFLRDDTRSAEIEYLGVFELNGVGCQRFSITPDGGAEMKVVIDSLSGDILRYATLLDDIELVTTMSDFREVEGVRVAFTTVTTSPIPQLNMTMTLTECHFNRPLDSALFAVNTLFAGAGKPAKRFTFQSNATGSSRMARIPIEESHGHVFVRATVGGSETRAPHKARFLLDTGAGSNIISAELAEALGLEIAGSLPVKGIAGYGSVGMVTIAELTIGAVTLLDQTVTAMRFDSEFRNSIGEFDGILGYEFFRHFVVHLNITEGEMIVYARDVAPEPSGVALAIDFSMRAPQTEATVFGQSGAFMIDLGNNGGILLHQRFAETLGLDSLQQSTQIAGRGIAGVGGSLAVSSVVAPEFKLAAMTLRDVPLSILSAGQGIAASEKIAGNIGAGFLRGFNVIFDYGNRRIWLQALD